MSGIKQYYALTATNKIIPLGKFKNFNEAWEYAEYETTKSYMWIFRKEILREVLAKVEEMEA
jgi:hypothetical protein